MQRPVPVAVSLAGGRAQCRDVHLERLDAQLLPRLLRLIHPGDIVREVDLRPGDPLGAPFLNARLCGQVLGDIPRPQARSHALREHLRHGRLHPPC
ncbi:hypothetical protein D3C80_1231680 [compost metagenome]